jgi:hypothetical protein
MHISLTKLSAVFHDVALKGRTVVLEVFPEVRFSDNAMRWAIESRVVVTMEGGEPLVFEGSLFHNLPAMAFVSTPIAETHCPSCESPATVLTHLDVVVEWNTEPIVAEPDEKTEMERFFFGVTPTERSTAHSGPSPRPD